MKSLSVVIITRNLEWNVPRLVESILAETSELELSFSEIVLVDSASTDKTIEVACRYPIKVVQLTPGQRLTAAAGRYTGYHQTTGDYILFLDGDFELAKGWLPLALAQIEQKQKIAAITGRIIDCPPDTPYDGSRNSIPQLEEPIEIKELVTAGSAAIFRRSILEEVGTFNPYIYSDEEPELSARIRRRGYKLVRLNRIVCFHYSPDADKISTMIGRWKRRLYLGAGQSLRYNVGKEAFWLYLRTRGFGIPPLIYTMIGVAALAIWISGGSFIWFGLWVLLFLAMIAAFTIKKRSFYSALYSIVRRILIMDGTVRGFLLKPLDPQVTPLQFEIIKDTN